MLFGRSWQDQFDGWFCFLWGFDYFKLFLLLQTTFFNGIILPTCLQYLFPIFFHLHEICFHILQKLVHAGQHDQTFRTTWRILLLKNLFNSNFKLCEVTLVPLFNVGHIIIYLNVWKVIGIWAGVLSLALAGAVVHTLFGAGDEFGHLFLNNVRKHFFAIDVFFHGFFVDVFVDVILVLATFHRCQWT